MKSCGCQCQKKGVLWATDRTLSEQQNPVRSQEPSLWKHILICGLGCKTVRFFLLVKLVHVWFLNHVTVQNTVQHLMLWWEQKKNHTDSKQPLVFSGLKTAKPSSDYFVFNTYTREPIETKLIYNQVLNNRAWMGSSSMCMCIYLHIFIYLCTHIFTIYTHTHITL